MHDEEDVTPVRMRLPLAIVLFGQSVEVSSELTFYYFEKLNRYQFQDFKGYFNGRLVDLMFLVDNDFGDLVSENKTHWNKDYEWWRSNIEEKRNDKQQTLKEKYASSEDDDFDPDDGPRYA